MEKTAYEIIADNALNPYELAVLKGIRQSKGGRAIKSKVISEAVTAVMNGEVEIDGEPMSVAEALMVRVVGEALANPTTSKLKDLATIIGDVGATKVEIITSAVDEELAKAALGEVDGAR